jgi:hypothetical protein
MGMDVYGINNQDAYFRANIWSWMPIHDLIRKLGSDIIDEENLNGMMCNDGYGIKDPKICEKLASRFEVWMEHNTEGKEIEPSEQFKKVISQIVSAAESAARRSSKDQSEDKVITKYGDSNFPKCAVKDDHLKEFVKFLRECGGFSVR